jgi:hypothetical protein
MAVMPLVDRPHRVRIAEVTVTSGGLGVIGQAR